MRTGFLTKVYPPICVFSNFFFHQTGKVFPQFFPPCIKAFLLGAIFPLRFWGISLFILPFVLEPPISSVCPIAKRNIFPDPGLLKSFLFREPFLLFPLRPIGGVNVKRNPRFGIFLSFSSIFFLDTFLPPYSALFLRLAL